MGLPREPIPLSAESLLRAGFSIWEKLLNALRTKVSHTTFITELACPATFRVQVRRILPNITFSLGAGSVPPELEFGIKQPARSDLFEFDETFLGRVVKCALRQLPISLIENLPQTLEFVAESCPVDNDLVLVGYDFSERTLVAVANASARGRAVIFCQHGFPYEFLSERNPLASLELTSSHLSGMSRRPFISWNNRLGARGTGSLRLASMAKKQAGRGREGRFYLEATVPPHGSASLKSSCFPSFLERNPEQAKNRTAHLCRPETFLKYPTVRGDQDVVVRVPHQAGRRCRLDFPEGHCFGDPHHPSLGRRLIPSAEFVVFENFSTGIAEALYYQTPFSIYCPREWYTVCSDNEPLRILLTSCSILLTAWPDLEDMLTRSPRDLEQWHRSYDVQLARKSLADCVIGPPFNVRNFAEIIKAALVIPESP